MPRLSNEQLTEWARRAARTNARLLETLSARTPNQAKAASVEAQRSNHLLLQALRRAGAEDGILRSGLATSGCPETPLHLLNSLAARRYASAIRAAAEACREMETERGIEDGLAEQLESFAESAEFELHGPVGLGLE